MALLPYCGRPDIPPSPSPVLIGVIVTFFVLSLLFGIGLFIWRRRKKHQAILLSSSTSSLRSSFGSDGWTHARDSTMVVGLGGSGASMGSGGLPAPDMMEPTKSGLTTTDPFARSRHASRSYSPSASSLNMRLPPDGAPVLPKFNQYPTPGSYVAFANAPESSSEGHSQERSAATHYEADTETFEPASAVSGTSFASPATTEQTFHTALHEHRRARSPTQRLSAIESIRTPRESGSESVDTC